MTGLAADLLRALDELDGLKARAVEALADLDATIAEKEALVERVKKELVQHKVDRRKLVVLAGKVAAPKAPRSSSPKVVLAGPSAFICQECGAGFASAQAIAMHGTRRGHATGYVSKSKPATVLPSSAGDVVPAPVVVPAQAPADPAADTVAEAPFDFDDVTADVLKLWDDWNRFEPGERARKIADAVGIREGRVRSIVRDRSVA